MKCVASFFFLTGIEYEDDLDVTDDDDDDDYETDSWVHCQNNFPDSSDRELSVNHTSSTHCQSPRCNYYGWEPHYHQPSIKLQEDESVSSLLLFLSCP